LEERRPDNVFGSTAPGVADDHPGRDSAHPDRPSL